MQMNRLLLGIYNLCKWITYFFYLNMIWLAFCLLGGIILGTFPSTVSLYTIARKTALGEEDIPLVKTFWHVYRMEFLRANGLGYLLFFIGSLTSFNLFFFRSFEGTVHLFMSFFMLIIMVVFIMLILYIFPVYVHYKLNILQYLRQALIIAFLHPVNLIIMLITCVATYYFLVYLPGFIPLFGVSILCHLNMWLAYQCFQAIERVVEKRQIGQTTL
ncbi:YesL family protein [Lederbergia sp. NSJ-179]|uniref:YesL family protein n=1 Tax=Lederbergia sp. NSJ-179 TaxID=2931402 RepID=UPI001FD1E6D7|nr:YesL family protein [Lederbergia sp. NSJ-179]MCJ7839774.1 YesL family protein [Lederbergia sp. NSJ-179]